MDPASILIVLLGVGLVAALGVAGMLLSRRNAAAGSADLAAIEKLLSAQQEMMGVQIAQLGGRLAQVTNDQAAKHGELTRTLNDRLDSLGQRVGFSLTDQAAKSAKAFGDLTARLRSIDDAQKNIVDLSTKVVTLQDILSNKQARGAFGQGQMETIISDSLPANAYSFQAQLSNGTRPDCLVHLPNAAAGVVIDAKFPRESFAALASAQGPEALRAAQTRVRTEIRKHIDDIAAKYLIPGETQDPAIMFLPAESICSALFADFYDVIQYAQRKRVAIVSPNMLMLAVSTMRGLLRDQQMREQAHLIQVEVRTLLEDVRRLDDRTEKLKGHFIQAEKDIREIEISTGKIVSRGEKIASVEIEEGRLERTSPQPMLLAGE